MLMAVLALLIAGSVSQLARADSVAPAQASVGEHRARILIASRDGFHGTFTYTVVPGDTLFSIAGRFDTTVGTIAALNGIIDPAEIRVGEHLVIPIPPQPAGPSRVIRNGSRSSGSIALTFDMGGRVDPALDIINWLIQHQVPATIFMTGAMAENPNTSAGREVLQLVAAHPELFDLGNHSYSHPDFTTLADAAIQAELTNTEVAVAKTTPVAMRPRWRPPFGAYDDRVLREVAKAGYSQTILWDVDTIDWRPESEGGPTAAQIVSKVLNNTQGGSIVLMHLGGYHTLEALPGILNGLAARGFSFTTVSSMPLP
jgi:peptidoglycan/xylan/chitin deacetylase (PgdA/CDA1 family)